MSRAVGILAVVLVACGSATTAPSPASGASAIPSPSGVPTAPASAAASATSSVLDGRFGFVVTGQDARVRSEVSDTVIDSFAPSGRSWTSLSRDVSPDGRAVAYWAPANKGAVMHVRTVAGGSDRVVFRTAPEMSGNAFTWSSDGSGLALAIDNDCQEICGAQGGSSINELWTVDVASGRTERIASGKFWLPITWDRTAKLVAAGVTGPGGYLVGYDLIDLHQPPYPVRSTEFRPALLGRLKASSDARFVLLSYDSAASSTLAWWPLAQPDKRADVPFDGAAAEWRPGTSEIWWVGGLTPAACRYAPCSGTLLDAFDVVSGGRTAEIRGSFGERILTFRPDGSAVMTGSTNSIVVVDIAFGTTARVAIGEAFTLASVRLR